MTLGGTAAVINEFGHISQSEKIEETVAIVGDSLQFAEAAISDM